MDSQVDFWTSKNSQISGGVAVAVPAAAQTVPTAATAPPVAGATVAHAGPVSNAMVSNAMVSPVSNAMVSAPTAFAGSLPTPANYDPSKLPALPCLRRWSADEVRTKLHEPIDEMRKRRGLPALAEEQRAKLVGEYVLRKVVGAPTAIAERAPGVTPPAGNGGGAGEAAGAAAADDGTAETGDKSADSVNVAPNDIPICGSLSFWLDPYGKWHCCECDPWKGNPGGPGSKMCRGYHVVDRVPVGGEVNGVAAKRFEVDGSVIEFVGTDWALRE